MSPSIESVESVAPGYGGAQLDDIKHPRSPIAMVIDALRRLIRHAGGYDHPTLLNFGSIRDRKRSTTIGSAVVISMVVGGTGWFYKVSAGGNYGLAVLIALAYVTLALILESFFTSEVNAQAPWWTRLKSFAMRLVMSAVIAAFAAMPWTMYTLRAKIAVESRELTYAVDKRLKKDAAQKFALPELQQKTSLLTANQQEAARQLATLPESIVEQGATAKQCEVESMRLAANTRTAIATDSARWKQVNDLLEAVTVAPRERDALIRERGMIVVRIDRMRRAMTKKAEECRALFVAAEDAKRKYIVEKEAQKAIADEAAWEHAKNVARAEQAYSRAVQEDEALLGNSVAVISAAEVEALFSLIRKEFYAAYIAGSIAFGLLLIDLLPVSLRLFVTAGPYDHARRRLEGSAKLNQDMLYDEDCLDYEMASVQRKVIREVVNSEEAREAMRRTLAPAIYDDLRDAALARYRARYRASPAPG